MDDASCLGGFVGIPVKTLGCCRGGGVKEKVSASWRLH